MDNVIIEYITQYIPLTEHEIEIILTQNVFKQYKRNDILLEEGEYAKECYFVIKGCVRSYYHINGEERNTDFFFENDSIRPISYQTKEPSRYYLSCIEDCILAAGDESRNKKLIELIPKLSSLILQMNDELLVKKTLELDNFKNNSPEERYMLLLKNHPDYLNRIPLYHLASYLGITQVSLSRIRSRITAQ